MGNETYKCKDCGEDFTLSTVEGSSDSVMYERIAELRQKAQSLANAGFVKEFNDINDQIRREAPLRCPKCREIKKAEHNERAFDLSNDEYNSSRSR